MKELKGIQAEIYNYVVEHPGISPKELARVLGKSRGIITKAIHRIRQKGYYIIFKDGGYYAADMNDIDMEEQRIIEETKMRNRELAEKRLLEKLKKEKARTLQIMEWLEEIITPINPDTIERFVLPEIKPRDRRSEEVMVAVIGDVHVGRKTPSYDVDTFIKRLEIYKHSLLKILSLHRNLYPINRLEIMFVGDIIDNTQIFPGQPWESDAETILQLEIAYKEFARMIMEIEPNFEEININCVPGNHGRISWTESKHTNWDMVFYKMIEIALKQYDAIHFHYPDNDQKNYLIREVMGHKFLITHGNDIKQYYNLPFYGMTRHAMRWQGAIDKDIEYVIFGHFHSINMGWDINDIHIMVNGTFISDDQWAIEKLGLKSSTKQLLFGVSRKRGITWRYGLDLMEV